MKLRFSSHELTKVDTAVLAVPVFEGNWDSEPMVKAVDAALGGLLVQSAKDEGFKGKSDQAFSFHTHGKIRARKVCLLGAGKRERAHLGGVRDLATRAVRAASRARSIAIAVPALEGLAGGGEGAGREALVKALAAGAALGAYRFEKYRTKDAEPSPLAEVVLCMGEGALPDRKVRLRAEEARIVAEAVAFARDLVNEPAIELTPSTLAEHARKVARARGLRCRVLGPREIRKLKMGLLLGVAAGSHEEPRFIHLTYMPRVRPRRRVALVGKGLTFDSGGLSLKPAKSMEDMKIDMAGAATVIATLGIVGALKPRDVEVHGVIGATENMPGGRAIRPGDILRSMSGKTVEVLNTDAEGRLVLADALHWVRTRQRVDEIIDVATLTGACMVALGRHTAGFFSNDEALAARYERAAKRAGEDAWRLPLTERLAESLRSTVADLKNVGDAYGGAISAALFLREFVGDTPWVHVDIAGPSFVEGKGPAAGGTGYGVMTLAELVMDGGGAEEP
jgi:leucyl aminopeptidase